MRFMNLREKPPNLKKREVECNENVMDYRITEEDNAWESERMLADKIMDQIIEIFES